MFTIRNWGGVALFLFGTTYLWLTPMFASQGIPTRGIWWSITQVLAFGTLLGFTIATGGLFKKSSWWDGVWGLHVWTHRINPKGTFAPWNPRVHC